MDAVPPAAEVESPAVSEELAVPEPQPVVTTLRFSATGDNLIHKPIYSQAARRAAEGEGYSFDYCYMNLLDFYAQQDINWINQETLCSNVYNTRNSNNPAQAKAYVNIAGSGMVIYRFRIGNYPLIARYQANLPLMGVMFSPEYGQSYYEIFSLKHGGKNILFTSLHNQPALRQLLTLDFPVGNMNVRAGYICDIQQAKVNHLKSHTWSHVFMLGFVKNFYLIKNKKKVGMSPKVSPY